MVSMATWEQVVHLVRRNAAQKSADNGRKPAKHCRAGCIWRF